MRPGQLTGAGRLSQSQGFSTVVDDLSAKLRSADTKELCELVRSRQEELSPDSVRQALRNSFVDGQVIDELLEHPRLRRYYEVRKLVASHPRTKQARAIGLVAGLYWRDLLRMSGDSRVRPAVRRAADMRLAERLGQLSTGEKLALARGAGAGLIPRVLEERDPQVVQLVLENPRLTEPLLAPLLLSQVTPAEILRLVASDRRWGSRYSTRLALCLNPTTPHDLSLSLLPDLKKVDQRTVAGDIRLAAEVRQRASLLAG